MDHIVLRECVRELHRHAARPTRFSRKKHVMFCPMQRVDWDCGRIGHAASRCENLRNSSEIELTSNWEAEFFLVECDSRFEPGIQCVVSECIVL